MNTNNQNSNNIIINKYYDIILEFIEVACHSILYVRGVYNACLFQRSLKYGIAVPMSRSTQLQNYVANTLDSLKSHLYNGTIEKISISIIDNIGTPIERFMFDINPLIQQPLTTTTTTTLNTKKKNKNHDNIQSEILKGGIVILDDTQTQTSQSQHQRQHQKQDKEFDNYLNIFKETNINYNKNQPQQQLQTNQKHDDIIIDFELLEKSFQSYLLKLLSSDSYLPFKISDRVDCRFTIYAYTRKRINNLNYNPNQFQIDPLNPPGGGITGTTTTMNRTAVNNNRAMAWIGIDEEEYQQPLHNNGSGVNTKHKVSTIPLKSIYSNSDSNQKRYSLLTSIEYLQSSNNTMEKESEEEDEDEGIASSQRHLHKKADNYNNMDQPMIEQYDSSDEELDDDSS